MVVSKTLRRFMAASILAAMLTIGLKTVAYIITTSMGLLSDALENTVNLLAAGTGYIAVIYATRPADKTHAFGHEKFEYFSSGLEGVLVILAGLGTAGYAVRRLFHLEPLDNLELGALINSVAAAINLGVARILIAQGRKHRSIVLEAHGKHLMADVLTSIGVLIALVLVMATGQVWIDPIPAILIGLYITWTGGELVLRSFNGLMDHALTLEEQEQIRTVIEATLAGSGAYHLLRTRRAGTRRFAEFHLLVDGDSSVRTAHHLAHRIESALTEAIPGLEVVIHIEPSDERDSWEREELKQLERPAGE